MRQTVHVRIEGRVQGVGYRGWMIAAAEELGLDGWVRNRRDGTVEACVHGDTEAVAQILALCHEGPAMARVERVTHEPSAKTVQRGFTQHPTV